MGKKSESVYSKKDIDDAYKRGLETAIAVLERTMDLSKPGRQKLIEKLKKIILDDKVKNIINKNYF